MSMSDLVGLAYTSPSDHPRPQNLMGESIAVHVDRELTTALKGLSREHGTTLDMTLLTGWAALTARLSGQDEVVIGTAVENTLALRLDLSGGPSVAELLAQVRQRSLQALEPEGTPAHSPFLFAWHNAPHVALVPAHFDLRLSLREEHGAIVGSLESASAHFDRSTMERHVGYLYALLQGMTSAEGGAVDQLPILSQAEREQVLQQWNTTQCYPLEQCIHQLFERQVSQTPDAVALEYEGQHLSYRELNERANQLAHGLQALGVVPDDRVAICMPRGMQMVVSLLAVLKAGGAFVPLDATYPRERLRYILQDIAPRALLTESALRDRLDVPSEVMVLDLDRAESVWQGESTANLERARFGLTPEHLAYIIYTSGSTGRPKGVMIEHRGLSHQITALQRHYELGPSDRLLQFVAPSFDVSLEEIFGALLSGATLVLRTDAWIASPQDFCVLCEQHRITVANLPTLFWQQLADAPGAWFPGSLRLIIIGGEAVSAASLERWWRRTGHLPVLYNAYGPTETTINATIADCGPNTPARSIGRPLPNVALYVLDRHGAPVPVGVAGEIHIGGAQVARGYWNRPELTRGCFVPDPFAQDPAARMYKTGDQGRWLSDGTIEFLGRNDHQVKIRGFRIELGEIEAALESHPGVKQALVLAREDEPGDKRLVGYVIAQDPLSPDAPLNAEHLRAHVRPLLPDYMVPSAFVSLESLPLTVTGKLDRRALPAPERQAYVGRQYQAPEGEVEEQLAVIWKDLLRVERVGRQDNFFEIGGHSLLGMKLITRVRESLNIRSTVMTIFRYPTIEEMARLIERLRSEAPTASVPHLPLTPRPPSSRAPLGLPQRWWWSLTQVDINRSYRSLSTAVRVSGPLNVDALKRSFAELVRRHEALRTSIVKAGGVNEQVIAAPFEYDLDVVALTEPSQEEREHAAARIFATLCDELLDVAVDPLFVAKLVKLADDDHVLIIALDHLVADAASMVVILRDVWTLYAQFDQGRPLSLPPIPLQFADYAVWQQDTRQSWIATHGAYWNEHLAGAQRIRLFGDEEAPKATRRGFGAAPMDFGKTVTAGLRELCRRERSTLAMSVLTAWVALVSRWCDRQDVVVPFLAMGRPGPEVENTVGCFVSPLYLRFAVHPDDTFLDLLKRVTEEYATAFEHDDLGHLGAQIPRPECTYNSCFNWHPKEFHLDPVTFLISMDSSEVEGLGDALTLRPFDVPEPDAESDDMVWDDEPGLFLAETPDEVAGLLLYRVERVASSTAEKLVRNLIAFAETLVAEPSTRLEDLSRVP